jgi:ribosome-binding protein aMBF1 (putative translation factor)
MSEAGMPNRRLSKVLNISREACRKWEIGECRPQPRNARKLEDLLGRTVEELFAPETQNGATEVAPLNSQSTKTNRRRTDGARYDKS